MQRQLNNDKHVSECYSLIFDRESSELRGYSCKELVKNYLVEHRLLARDLVLDRESLALARAA